MSFTLLAAAALAGSVAVAPAASAESAPPPNGGGHCVMSWNSYEVNYSCRDSAPGTQFRIVVRCPDGLRYSRWENQSYTNVVTMRCTGIRVVDIRYR